MAAPGVVRTAGEQCLALPWEAPAAVPRAVHRLSASLSASLSAEHPVAGLSAGLSAVPPAVPSAVLPAVPPAVAPWVRHGLRKSKWGDVEGSEGESNSGEGSNVSADLSQSFAARDDRLDDNGYSHRGLTI